MSEAKTYTATDIERYHSGRLSAAERHALEKAALNDPFLADALEGYATAKTPAADLASLQQRLQLRIEKEKSRRGIFYTGNNWMRVAALFMLIALGGWLIIQMQGDKNSAKNMAVAEKKPAVSETVRDSTTIPSAAPLATASVPQETKKEAKRTIAAKSKNTGHRAGVQNAGRTALPNLDMALTQDSARILGYVARNSAPLVAAKKEAFRQLNTFAKAQAAEAKSTDTIKDVNITLKRSDEGLQEVVVAKARKQPVRRMNVVIDTLEPAEGWTNFDDYVASHLREPEELKEKGVTGQVELSFDVNDNGEPVNISVSKSLCARCDEEAVRLLKEGPKWKPNKKKGKIKIKFPMAP